MRTALVTLSSSGSSLRQCAEVPQRPRPWACLVTASTRPTQIGRCQAPATRHELT